MKSYVIAGTENIPNNNKARAIHGISCFLRDYNRLGWSFAIFFS